MNPDGLYVENIEYIEELKSMIENELQRKSTDKMICFVKEMLHLC